MRNKYPGIKARFGQPREIIYRTAIRRGKENGVAWRGEARVIMTGVPGEQGHDRCWVMRGD